MFVAGQQTSQKRNICDESSVKKHMTDKEHQFDQADIPSTHSSLASRCRRKLAKLNKRAAAAEGELAEEATPKKRKRPPKHPIEDGLFKLDEMERFVEDAEREAAGGLSAWHLPCLSATLCRSKFILQLLELDSSQHLSYAWCLTAARVDIQLWGGILSTTGTAAMWWKFWQACHP